MAPPTPSSEHVAQTEAVRAALRREKIAARAALDAAHRAAHETAIAAILEPLLTSRTPGRIGFCWPMQGEFDARPLVERLRARDWTACLPVVVAEGRPLAFRDWTPAAPLAPDRYGIPSPTAGDFVVPDVLLIPLVAFDAGNFRIGYGGGFFDRTLAALAPRPYAIGVGFELARVADTFPGPHDIALDVVVTETGSRQR
jgi:5,10-methenyltetrahydrofolate synthetase